MLTDFAQWRGLVKWDWVVDEWLMCSEPLTKGCLTKSRACRSVLINWWPSGRGAVSSGEELEKTTTIQVNLSHKLHRFQCSFSSPRARHTKRK
mgnify:CR=1 FL=1